MLSLNLKVAEYRINESSPLIKHKTSNKLLSILALLNISEDEVLFLNSKNRVTETNSSNLFWIKNDRLYTSHISDGILPGVTRELVIELTKAMGIPFREKSIILQELIRSDGIFLTRCSCGVANVKQVDDKKIAQHPFPPKLFQAYRQKLSQDCPHFPTH